MQIAMIEKQVISQFQISLHLHPQKLRDLLIRYFQDMQASGKLADCNPEAQALAFMWMNHGAFVSQLNEDKLSFSLISLDVFIEESVRTFARALTP